MKPTRQPRSPPRAQSLDRDQRLIDRLRKQLLASILKVKQESHRNSAARLALKKSKQHSDSLLEQSRQVEDRCRNLSRQLLLAQEEERKQISRELHDEIAQILTGIKIRLAALTLEASANTQGIKKKINGTKLLIEESIATVHRFAVELRPAILDDLGLIPALHSFMKSLTKRSGLRIHFTCFAGVEKLSSSKRTTLFRVTQSAMNNVAQHAKATSVWVKVRKILSVAQLEIKDNGVSFNPDRILHATRPTRLGLLSMRERVEMVGGTFAIASAPGQGTKITVRIPFSKAEV